MKRSIILLAVGMMISMHLAGQPNIMMDSTPAPGVYEASESITLLPGFSFTASSGNSLTLRINPCATGDPGYDFVCRMNHIFQHVDKSRITTGLLSDYGLQMIEPRYFDGVPADSNYVDITTWRMLYSGMFSSKINNNVSLTAPETVFSQIGNATHVNAVPVAMMHYQYNALNENAIAQNLLQIINGDQFQDVPGAASPYLTRQLFAAAPKELMFDGGDVSFVFNNTSLWYTNVNKTVQKREVSFDNRASWKLASLNIPVSHSYGAYLHIYNGVNSMPTMQQIVVKR